MNFYTILSINFAIGMLGEYFCKLASQTDGTMRYVYTCITMCAWGATAWFWVRLYELKPMSEAIAIYNPLQLIVSASIAILLFSEPFTWKIGVAYCLVALIFWLLN